MFYKSQNYHLNKKSRSWRAHEQARQIINFVKYVYLFFLGNAENEIFLTLPLIKSMVSLRIFFYSCVRPYIIHPN